MIALLKRLFGIPLKKKVRYYVVEVCIKCEVPLSDYDMHYSGGCCSHCGHTSSGTIADYKKVTVRKEWME